MEELYKIYDKDDIENEKEHIKISGDSCAKYIALEYVVPVCEELIIRNHEFDDMNMSPIIEDYLFVPIEWYARKYLENQFVFEKNIENHVVMVVDVISRIFRTDSGEIVVSIGSGSHVNLDNSGSFVVKTITCYLDMQDENIIEIANMLKTDRDVSIMGVMEGCDRVKGFVLSNCTILEYDDKVIDSIVDESLNIVEEAVKKYNLFAYKENKRIQERQAELEEVENQRKLKFEKERALEEKKQKDFLLSKLRNICPNCNRECGRIEKYCRYCGTKLNTPYSQIMKQILAKEFERKSNYVHYYFYPEIPNNIASNAITAYAPDINLGDIVALYDTSVRGNGKTGMIFTDSYLYFKPILWKGDKIKYTAIQDINISGRDVNVITADGKECTIWDYGMDEPESFVKILNMILELQIDN